MLRAALAPILLCCACALYAEGDPEEQLVTFERHYRLDPAMQFAASGAVGGIAWGHDCLWIATQINVGGYYDNNDYALRCRDIATGEVMQEFLFDYTYAEVRGIEYVNNSLWVNFSATGASHMQQFDATTGELLERRASTDHGPSDLAFDGTYLLLADHWNWYDKVNVATGAFEGGYDTPFEYSTLRGIAHRPGEVWLSGWIHNQLAVLDESGTQVGAADVSALRPTNYSNQERQLTFVDDRLAINIEGRIYIMDVVEIEPYEQSNGGFALQDDFTR